MTRRTLVLAAALLVFTGPMAMAASFEDSVVDQLRAQGYSEISVSRTLLGRAQIIATSAGEWREIILNPRTGEILRDYSQRTEADGSASVSVAAPVGPAGSGSAGEAGTIADPVEDTPDEADAEKAEDQADAPDDGNDDRSGSGSGSNSGSGSGSSSGDGSGAADDAPEAGD